MLITPAQLSDIPAYMLEWVVEAVRRDLRQEQQKAESDPWYHGINAHHDKQLLQFLNPKQTSSTSIAQVPAKVPAKVPAPPLSTEAEKPPVEAAPQYALIVLSPSAILAARTA